MQQPEFGSTATVTIEVAGGEVGRGTHKRAVVSTSRLLAGIAKRVPAVR